MREKLVKFFEEYKNLFREDMSSGDADDVLMDLMQLINKEEADKIIESLKNEFYC